MYLAKSHLSTAYVLRDRQPPHHFFTESLETRALIYLSIRQELVSKRLLELKLLCQR